MWQTKIEDLEKFYRIYMNTIKNSSKKSKREIADEKAREDVHKQDWIQSKFEATFYFRSRFEYYMKNL